MDFTIHTPDTAPDDAKPLLQTSINRYKFVPNLHGVMAESPPVLQAYQALGDLYGKTDLSVLERQVVLLTINYENECHYCVAAHSAIATMEKMPEAILTALRTGTALADTKLQTLRDFARKVVVTRGWVSDDDVQALLAAGYTRRTALEVVLAVSFKVLSNYVNHLAETPVDAPFTAFAWSKDASQAAE